MRCEESGEIRDRVVSCMIYEEGKWKEAVMNFVEEEGHFKSASRVFSVAAKRAACSSHFV